MGGLFSKANAAPLVAVRKNLDLVWVWFYKEVAPQNEIEIYLHHIAHFCLHGM
jgi:hypothetical protein